jgi:hypothetical protein
MERNTGEGKGVVQQAEQVRDFCQEMFGKLPDFLNKREAFAIIQQLPGRPR